MADAKREIPTKEEIEQRAYEIYVERGNKDGKHIEDWIEAEKELYEQYFESKTKTRGEVKWAAAGSSSSAPASSGSSSGSSGSIGAGSALSGAQAQKPAAFAASAGESGAGASRPLTSPTSTNQSSANQTTGGATGGTGSQTQNRTPGFAQKDDKGTDADEKKGNQKAGYKE